MGLRAVRTGIGVAAGFLDSSVNTAVALANRNRLLNMLHGCYGIGTTIGPLVITALSWPAPGRVTECSSPSNW